MRNIVLSVGLVLSASIGSFAGVQFARAPTLASGLWLVLLIVGVFCVARLARMIYDSRHKG